MMMMMSRGHILSVLNLSEIEHSADHSVNFRTLSPHVKIREGGRNVRAQISSSPNVTISCILLARGNSTRCEIQPIFPASLGKGQFFRTTVLRVGGLSYTKFGEGVGPR